MAPVDAASDMTGDKQLVPISRGVTRKTGIVLWCSRAHERVVRSGEDHKFGIGDKSI